MFDRIYPQRPLWAFKGVARRGTSVAVMILFGWTEIARAQDLSWNLTSNGNWNTTDPNWIEDGVVAPLAFTNGASVTFEEVGGFTVTIDDGSVQVSDITFVEDGYAIAQSSGGAPFAIEPTGGAFALTLNAGVTATVTAPFTGTDPITVVGTPTSTLALSGDSSGATGELDITGGTVTLSGDYGGAVTNSGESLTNTATISGLVTNNADLTAAGTFSSGITNAAGTVTVTADSTGNITNTGGDLTVNLGQTLTGDVTNADAAPDTVVDGSVVGNLTVFDGTVDNNGTVTGNTDVSGGALTNDGTLDGALIVTGGTVDNTASVVGNVTVNGGTVTNSGSLGGTVVIAQTGVPAAALNDTGGTIAGLVTNTDGTITADGTTFTSGLQQDGGTTTATGTDFGTGATVAGGALAIDGAMAATSTGDVALTGGDLTVAAGQTLTGAVTSSDAASETVIDGTVTGDLTVSDGTVDNNGTVTGNADVSGGALTNDGTLDGALTQLDGDVTNTGDVTGNTIINSGTFTNSGGLGGTLVLDQTGAVPVELNDTGGVIAGLTTNVDGSITADGTTFAGGLRQVDGNTEVTGTDFGTGLNVDGGSVTIFGSAPATSSGDATLSGGDLVVGVDQTFAGDIVIDDLDSGLRNIGTIVGDVTVNDGVFNHEAVVVGNVIVNDRNFFSEGGRVTGTVTQSGGISRFRQSQVDGGLIISDGTSSIREDSTLDITNTGGRVDVASGQTLTGNIVQTDGRTDLSGVVDGTLTASGGRVDHGVGADITGLTTLQGGVEFNADGGTFTGGLRVEDADLTLTGPLVGDLENAGEALSFGDGVILDGDVLNSAGTLDLGALVTGTLTVDDGAVTTTPTATIQGATTVNGGTLTADGSTFDGGITVAGGDVAITEVGTINGMAISDGTLVVEGTTPLTTDLDVSGGDTTLTSDMVGSVTQSGGTVTRSGQLDGTVDLSDGTFTNADGSISGATTVTGGTLVADGGDFAETVTSQGGTVRITGESTGSIANVSGEVIAETGGTLDGSITNQGTVTGAGGSITGDLTNTGTVDVTGGDLTVGDLTSTGSVTVSNGHALGFDTAEIGGGTLAVTNGTLDGDVTVAAGVDLTASNMTVTGDFATMTDLVSNGALSIGGDFVMDDSDLTIATGRAEIGGDVTFADDVFVTLVDGTGLSGATITNAGQMAATGTVAFAGDFTNSGTLTATGAQSFDGPFTNTGTLTATGDLSFSGLFTNSGVFGAEGSLTFGGGLQNTSGITTVNNDPTDTITIGGAGLSGGGTLQFDVDLSNEVGVADQVTMAPGAFITGDVTLNFNVLGSGAQQPVDLVLIDVAAGDPGNFNIAADEIIDPSGILTYSVTRNAAGDVVIEDALTPAIAGLAGNIVLTQSLIGSVVNRPSSPFVTSLAYEDDNPCGSGMWARTIGGGATSAGEVSEFGLEGGAFDGRISATFAGVQLGADFACFNGVYNGWDLAVGSIGGVNIGQTSQPVFAIDLEQADNLSDRQTSTTTVDFTQFYSGVYATAVRGPWAVDLQYRFEMTDFTATNEGADGLPGLGLDDTAFDSFATTLSGAASYVYNVPDTNIALVPTAGFAFTQVSTDEINFESRGIVRIDDFDSRIGFIGGTLAISNFGDDGVSAYQEFVSATIYNDFADGPTSTFSPVDESGDRRLRTENLGLYSELSVGVNYVKVLQPGEFGAVKQLSANARADLRISERLKSWGITAQARYQF
ncbi:MAG: hypothetical protein AAFQ64_12685 [Pseudomonadota bacterium]